MDITHTPSVTLWHIFDRLANTYPRSAEVVAEQRRVKAEIDERDRTGNHVPLPLSEAGEHPALAHYGRIGEYTHA